MTYFDRVKAFVEYKGLTIKQFEEKCKLANGLVKKMTDKTRETTYDRIIYAFPDINIEWLKTGEGEMLRNQGHSASGVQGHNLQVGGSTSNVSQGSDEVLVKALDEMAAQRRDYMASLAVKDAQIDRLLSLLERRLGAEQA